MPRTAASTFDTVVRLLILIKVLIERAGPWPSGRFVWTQNRRAQATEACASGADLQKVDAQSSSFKVHTYYYFASAARA